MGKTFSLAFFSFRNTFQVQTELNFYLENKLFSYITSQRFIYKIRITTLEVNRLNMKV